jgi:hypothetical protein
MLDANPLIERVNFGDVLSHVVLKRQPSLLLEKIDCKSSELLGDGSELKDCAWSDRNSMLKARCSISLKKLNFAIEDDADGYAGCCGVVFREKSIELFYGSYILLPEARAGTDQSTQEKPKRFRRKVHERMTAPSRNR